MKISSIIWLKGYAGNTGRTYTSRVYAVEAVDQLGYEIEALRAFAKSMGRDEFMPGNIPLSLIKRINPYGSAGTEAFDYSNSMLSLVLRLYPHGIFIDDVDAGSMVTGVSKKNAANYLSRTLFPMHMDATSTVVGIRKISQVVSTDDVIGAIYAASAATSIDKVSRVITGFADGHYTGENAVQLITKTARYVAVEITAGFDATSFVTLIDKVRHGEGTISPPTLVRGRYEAVEAPTGLVGAMEYDSPSELIGRFVGIDMPSSFTGEFIPFRPPSSVMGRYANVAFPTGLVGVYFDSDD